MNSLANSRPIMSDQVDKQLSREILLPAGVASILGTLHKNGYEAYVVGGCVRDSLLGLTPKDWDICTSATPIEIKGCFVGRRIIETGIKHGTVTVVEGEEGYEITTFRLDGEYSDHRRPDNVTYICEVAVDLSRRDFTMNAMAYNEKTGLVDPFHGFQSLQERTVSCVGNPDNRFKEDPLRILRAIRFSSVYGFSISEETADSIHRNAELLKNISAERINAELCKILCGESVLQALLQYKDIMAVIIPELRPCIGFDQNNRYHQYDVYEHIAHAVANYHGSDTVTKMALLLHDIGKPICYSEDERGGHFYNHSIPGFSIAKDVTCNLRFDKQSQHDIAELVLYHDTVIEPTNRTVRKWLNRLGEEQFFRLMDIRLADIRAHADGTQDERLSKYYSVTKIAKEIISKNQCFTVKQLAINGNDILRAGVQEGPIVGAALTASLGGVMGGKVANQKTALLDYIRRYFDFVKKHIDAQQEGDGPFCPFDGVCFCDAAFTDRCFSCETAIEKWNE